MKPEPSLAYTQQPPLRTPLLVICVQATDSEAVSVITAVHSPPTSAKVKKEWTYSSTNLYAFMWCITLPLSSVVLRNTKSRFYFDADHGMSQLKLPTFLHVRFNIIHSGILPSDFLTKMP